jgi:hypothetical protein
VVAWHFGIEYSNRWRVVLVMLLFPWSPIHGIGWQKVEEQQDDHVGLVDVDVVSNLEEQNLDH